MTCIPSTSQVSQCSIQQTQYFFLSVDGVTPPVHLALGVHLSQISFLYGNRVHPTRYFSPGCTPPDILFAGCTPVILLIPSRAVRQGVSSCSKGYKVQSIISLSHFRCFQTQRNMSLFDDIIIRRWALSYSKSKWDKSSQ